MKVEYINAVCNAVEGIFDNFFGIKGKFGAPYAGKVAIRGNQVSVLVGVNQDLDGQIIISLNYDVAMKIIGLMMGGAEVNEIDEMGWSALQEFGNWVAGASATELYSTGEVVDVTTPIINEGNSQYRSGNLFVTVPLVSDIGELDVHISLSKKDK